MQFHNRQLNNCIYTKLSTAMIKETSSAGTPREFKTMISITYPPLGIPAAPMHDNVQVMLQLVIYIILIYHYVTTSVKTIFNLINYKNKKKKFMYVLTCNMFIERGNRKIPPK